MTRPRCSFHKLARSFEEEVTIGGKISKQAVLSNHTRSCNPQKSHILPAASLHRLRNYD